MPYRRLPNTDSSRLKALNSAHYMGKELPPFKLAFSQKNYQRVQSIIPAFENAITFYRQTYSTQVKKNPEYSKALKMARLYISHFIQVMNMGILRGDLKKDMRKYYGLESSGNRIPPLNTEADIIKWGKKIIDGEHERISRGGTPMSNPTIAVVKVRYEKFREASQCQKSLKKKTAAAHEKVAALRPEADRIISDVWDEVEKSYKNLPDDLRREKAKNYGVVYVFRKNEIYNLGSAVFSGQEIKSG